MMIFESENIEKREIKTMKKQMKFVALIVALMMMTSCQKTPVEETEATTAVSES